MPIEDLEIGEERHGVHAFLVPIRSLDGTPMAGVAIEDCGHKGAQRCRQRPHRLRHGADSAGEPAGSLVVPRQWLFRGVKAEAIRDQVTRLCAEVGRSALPLVESFGIPDEILAAPIAGSAESPGTGRT